MKLFKAGLTLLGAALALVVAVPQTATATDEPGGGATPMIIGGGNASNAPWAARLFVNGQQNCTATIIAPQYILTAKHCVSSSGTYTFRIGSLDQTSGGTMATGGTITRNPSADIAIVRLTTSVAATYSPLGTTSSVSTGQSVQVYGWGATCTGQPEINCQSRLLKVANVNVTSVSCSDYAGGIAVCASRGNGITAGGDSGGPMFASGRQVGVASTSDRATRTAYTNITRYRSWITSVAGV
ncbi:S1 family peptidase [Actinophytocola oryzae]|uniref:Trypsin n=1 Tax=Actinophytocola oryzae TaxID=502181 RepID=A0A4R7VY82_9PSEU|nr:trypsin-like serine protease [Actinophytocola oryzae]TDV55024.1 trypsin [Actinophytocola oryzae]